jgi:hypothetical protein
MLAGIALLAMAAAAPVRQPLCEPSAQVGLALEEAVPGPVAQADVERVLRSLRGLRERFPDDPFVHVRFQDVVFEAGTEGHLKSMLRDYQRLSADRPDDTVYEYLAGRAFLGRGTKKAIAKMERIVECDPGFATALRTLAEIHGSERFADPAKERREREAFAALCPGSRIAQRPSPLPARPRVFERAQATPEEIAAALQTDQERLMRIRLFDWYSEESKAEELRAVQEDSWKGWRLLVEHYRRTGDAARADAQLAEMEGRLARLRDREGGLRSLAAGILLELRTSSAADTR